MIAISGDSQVPYTLEDYEAEKQRNPDFYRDANSLEYGRSPDIPEENVDKMVEELNERYCSKSFVQPIVQTTSWRTVTET